MSLPKETACTIENIYALPDGQRAELIDGQMYMMAPPTYKHQRLVVQLSRIIGNYIAEQKSTCEVLPAPFAVNLHADNETYVEPDISVICDKNKLSDRGCEGAPDFIIEIVSPSSRRMDYNTKNALYLEAGVREYWIVDPAKECTTVYRYEEDAAPMICPFEQPITVEIYGNLQITVSELLN